MHRRKVHGNLQTSLLVMRFAAHLAAKVQAVPG
jgi:hypothetical protein